MVRPVALRAAVQKQSPRCLWRKMERGSGKKPPESLTELEFDCRIRICESPTAVLREVWCGQAGRHDTFI